MSVFKCKMCGGSLDIQNNETVVECEYCGSKQTLPKLDSERRANLYDRANHFRRNNEFDKAIGIYEQILNEDTTDCEAYWSLVLCRYGIEYVEDPSTHKHVPTINRAQFTSIYDDDNYKSALANADASQRIVYENEAKAINDIQKEILSISQKEEPFDIFICYKETDNNGRRTPDSVLANDLYHQLTQEGFKVFFSRITLEDKLGTAYEPYIFAALNSAKIMVVLGTKPEYFNAVWVKNEWSRYLSLIKNGSQKMLIPAYKDMDPYDLPEEFSHLQAQDMAKLGFMQDLIRGIKKITDTQEPKPTIISETVISNTSTTTNIDALLKRVFMFLEDKAWDSADEYCEKILDINPECAEAYLGKLMAELNIRTRQDLKELPTPFTDNNNFQKIMRFADEDLKNELQTYIDFISNRLLEDAYNMAVITMNRSLSENSFRSVAVKFRELNGYKDSEALARECLEKAEATRKNTHYTSGLTAMNKNTKCEYQNAIQIFKRIYDWKDSAEKISICESRIAEIEQAEEAKRLEDEHIAETNRIAQRKRTIISIVVIAAICITVISILIVKNVIIPNSKYNNAIELLEEGKYQEAIKAFEKMGDYKYSKKYITKAKDGINEAKYIYATSPNNRTYTNMTTYKYLQELKAINYKDSAEQFEEIFSWKATIIANYSKDDSTTDISTSNTDNRIYFHIKLSGGEPNAETKLSYVGYYANTLGNTKYKWDGTWQNGSSSYCSFLLRVGTFNLLVLDEKENVIGEKIINITK